MKHKSQGAGLAALLLAVAVAASLGQTKPTTPVAIPYSREPIAEITKLKPVVSTPRDAQDLQAIQDRVQAVARHALPAIVNLIVEDGQGSGVIISKDGYVLTAGHVSGAPNQDILLRLSNGTYVEGKTLGANNQWDAGMVKITTPGDYSYMPLGTTNNANRAVIGQWVVAMGHPGGWETGRAPVVRLGKIIGTGTREREWYIQTDCPLIMGDSGGPVFDLDGRVVGINSRIGIRSTSNVHVPVDAFIQDWDRLAKGDKWGDTSLLAIKRPELPSTAQSATLRLKVSDQKEGVFITNVGLGSGSEKAGIMPQDVITRLNGEIVTTVDQLTRLLSKHKPGEKITLDLLRESKTVQVNVVLDATDNK
jgi:serine protease Do